MGRWWRYSAAVILREATLQQKESAPDTDFTLEIMNIRILAVWFVMLLVSILNGTMRDFTYGKQIPELLAHQISTASAIVLLGFVIFLYARKWPFLSARQAWLTGLFWMSLTVAFEFLFFHYAGGHTWQALLANYDISKGRLWPLILIWVVFAPYLIFRLSPPHNGSTTRT